jgi:hypothetical protein
MYLNIMISITNMAQIMKYTLQDFINITFDSFDFSLPRETIELINKLAHEVGSPTYIKTPIFQKREGGKDINMLNYKKKKGGVKGVEEDWDTIRSFQTTKIEQKVGLDLQIDLIRSYLNKMTDRNFCEIKNKIIELLDKLIEDGIEKDELTKIGENIFEIASNNRFYSKLYADLYSELIEKYDVMKTLFENSLNTYMEMFHNIEYVDASEDYDKFCKINKINENRKSISTFFVNLMLKSIISKEVINNLLVSLFKQIYTLIYVENKKNEVDELVENVAILYQKDIVSTFDTEIIEGKKLVDLIIQLANSKSKNFPSLSNKSIFKFIDLIEM